MKGDIVMSKEKLDELIAATKLGELISRKEDEDKKCCKKCRHNSKTKPDASSSIENSLIKKANVISHLLLAPDVKRLIFTHLVKDDMPDHPWKQNQ